MKILKRIGIVLAVMLAFAGTANAKIINFGIKAGLNVNHLSFNKDFAKDLTSKSNSTGWEAGVMAEVNVPLVGLCFDASVMYARMNNSTQAYVADGSSYEVFNGENVGKNFLMIPINIKYKFQVPGVSGIVAPYLFTGPEFGIKLDKNIKDAIETRTCQVAWNIGIGLELVRHIQVGASYGFGINNIAKKALDTNAPDYKVKNNYWTVTAAWLF